MKPHLIPVFFRLCMLLCWGVAMSFSAFAQTPRGIPSVALNYSANPPLEELRIFDIVVVEADHDIDPNDYRSKNNNRSELFAYVAAGEALASRSWYKDMPASMRPATNAVWASAVIDQTHPDWPEFFVEKIVTPLWNKGYRGFFLDTMDSYQLLAKDDSSRNAQEAGLVATIRRLKQKYPQARLIANRGFEVLPQLKNEIFMIAAESLFRGWNHAQKTYTEVKIQDREWLARQLIKARDELGMHALAIDYVAPHQRELQRDTARQILALGIQAYVTDPELASIGTGRWQLQPRRILVLHDTDKERDLHQSEAVRFLQFPLNHLGYRVDMVNVSETPAPTGPLLDRYAGVITWMASNAPASSSAMQSWIKRAFSEKLPLLSMNQLPFPINQEWTALTGLTDSADRIVPPLRVAQQLDEALTSFEIKPAPRINNFAAVTLTRESLDRGAKPWLQVADARNRTMDVVGITPWGGFALPSFTIVELPSADRQRWVSNPIELIRQALRLKELPMPDLTTEAGRRLLMVHIDGDGFASRAEIKGTPFAASVMADEFISQYKVPHTVSIIGAEVASNGLYKALTPTLEGIARRIFALPNVELATHTYSHPFYWRDAVSGTSKRNYNLQIPGYQFDLDVELKGSAQYIESLAPPGKKTKVVLWSGDCVIPPSVLKRAYEHGLLNMNGGDTLMTKSNPTLTSLAPFSLRKNGYLQIFAPNQNENVYTNLWTGPFYGYERAIETFDMTETPKRLKPINIYYHTYSAAKPGSIAALKKVYDYALAQQTNPIFGSDYIQKAMEWEAFAMAQDVLSDAPSWRFVSGDTLRTIRMPRKAEQQILWASAENIAGFAHGPGFTYAHMTAGVAHWTESASGQQGQISVPFVINANGKLSNLRRTPNGLSFQLDSHVVPEFVLALTSRCSVKTNQHEIKGKPVQTSEITLNSGVHAAAFTVSGPASLAPGGPPGPSSVLVSIQCG
jgi:polysaccharide biosynthesis protein PelA